MQTAAKTFQHFRDVVADYASKAAKAPRVLVDDAGYEAHALFRDARGHSAPGDRKKTDEEHEHTIPGITEPGSTGVIYVMDRATANGFSYGNKDWANFGQGAPEVGPIPGGSARPTSIDLASMGEGVNEYAPTAGVKELREAVANLYNQTYRQGKDSQYTHENVCIVPGGRAGLIRVAAVIGDVYVAYQIPEYTAYSSMLSCFRRMVPVPMSLAAGDRYKLHVEELRKNVKSMGISVIVASNPRNPTGQVIEGEELEKLVQLGREGTTLVLDEFYSWYQYDEKLRGKSVSAAAYVDDVNKDPIIIIDGLTKNFRLPGWRVCWVAGPRSLITALGQSGSYLDGGCSHPSQLAAIPLLEPQRVQQDKEALQQLFLQKRNHVLDRLDKMGLKVDVPPVATFYIWLDLSGLPAPLNSGLTFFEELLKEKTIVVPGIFFDVNPSHRRNLFDSPCNHYVRLSFGPPLAELDKGLDGIQRLVDRARHHYERDGHLRNGTGQYKRSNDSHRTAGSLNAPSSGS